jgi:hypothetical protein
MSDHYSYSDSGELYQQVNQLVDEATFEGRYSVKIAEDASDNDFERIKAYCYWLNKDAGVIRRPVHHFLHRWS